MDNPDAMDSLIQLAWRVVGLVDDAARPLDLSTSQVRLLGILRDREPEILDIARSLGLDKSSVSGLVARAEARGLVQRFPAGQDRRRIAVRLTAKGRAQVELVEGRVYAALDVLLAELPEGDRGDVRSLL
ncbi:MarR family transcriptional regulator [soil metagenome]